MGTYIFTAPAHHVLEVGGERFQGGERFSVDDELAAALPAGTVLSVAQERQEPTPDLDPDPGPLDPAPGLSESLKSPQTPFRPSA